MIRCGRSNAVSFVKTQNMQTLFSPDAFSNTSFCGRWTKKKLRSQFLCFKRAPKCALCCSVNWWYIWKLECFCEFCYFSIFFCCGNSFFLFQENAFLLFSQEKKRRNDVMEENSNFLYVSVMHSMMKFALERPIRLMNFFSGNSSRLLKPEAFSRKKLNVCLYERFLCARYPAFE